MQKIKDTVKATAAAHVIGVMTSMFLWSIYIYHSSVARFIVQELCESRGGRPGLSVLTNLKVSVDVKQY